MCSVKKGVRKFHRKRPVLESLFNKVQKACNSIKQRLQHSMFSCEIFKNTYFEKHLQASASVSLQRRYAAISFENF